MSYLVAIKGFTLGLSMIVPIGAQNAMILNQGINRNHHLLAAALCAFYDILLISIGIMGGSLILNSNDTMFTLLTWGGILFLIGYGASAYQAAFSEQTTDSGQKRSAHKSIKVIVLTSLVVTFLNPHAYIDTVMVIGSVGGQFDGVNKYYFMAGAMAASLVWFFTLASGAAKLSHLLARPKVKQGIDLAIAAIMWIIAASLFQSWIERFYS
ncbi:LysE/ArgO family amino acid transporter [Psychrobium sp. MM17-31]|uniref:LysE/ArgO family amino acid transporter n=1 Tax=Psychrobium sp. MM17-31 TaxID=2917758 RepID=UPI001EF5DEBF|nr:LysE/ArgO family amino acid transporter [Psychrobium sp. MM17-31]MCG7531060.1 LysE/ArgO family amino acid transporter [Psychrobium sp. MM17-31]